MVTSGRGARTIVITGISRGLGRAMARRFAAAGHTVAGCGRNRADVETLANELGDAHRFDSVDVTSDAVGEWAEAVIAAHGAPDLLVNNAGLINQPAFLWKIPDEEFSRVVEVNLIGVFRVCKAFLPAMIARGTGVVANFSSGWGRSTSPEVAPYCATKWAVEGLTQALAQELPAGMAAVAVNPGVIHTDMLATAWADGARAYPRPEDWAERAVPFLLGIDASDSGRPLSVP